MGNRRELFQDSEFSIETADQQRFENDRIESLGQIQGWMEYCRVKGGKWHRVLPLLERFLREVSKQDTPGKLTNTKISFANMTHRWIEKGDWQ